MDAANTNAQNLNAKALLSRFKSANARWVTTYYDEPDRQVAAAPQVELKKLWRRRFWHWDMLLQYQNKVDAIFYPGMEWFDLRGLEVRKRLHRRIPVIGTLEGLAGDEVRERKLETILGHKIYCHRVGRDVIERCDRILHSCDHIIAITPMLAKIGRELYGEKVSALPLGINSRTFHQRHARKEDEFRIIGVGNLTANKRPELFVDLAQQFPNGKFVWFGQGSRIDELRARCSDRKITNLEFSGMALPQQLADEYNRSSLFLLPSISEGAPKVLQEAAACGLPRIAFGFYEPAITHGFDGFVVWTDEEFVARVAELVRDPMKAREMGSRAAETAANWNWDVIAPQWENEILARVDQLRSR
jgi:glycosyltransferase involved in cell wall biosynthesis